MLLSLCAKLLLLELMLLPVVSKRFAYLQVTARTVKHSARKLTRPFVCMCDLNLSVLVTRLHWLHY
jgi:hypothetical protein